MVKAKAAGSGFEMRLIGAKATGEEIGYIDSYVDFEIGNTMDFELELPIGQNKYDYGCRVFIPQTEFGGLLEDMKFATSEKKLYWKGHTWRGLLTKKVVEPPKGQEHLILNGELNKVLQELVGQRFDSLFRVSDSDTGIVLQNWKVDRYVTLYDAITKLFEHYNHRLQIEYVQPEGVEYGYVLLQAVPIVDWSEEIEYSEESKVRFVIRDFRGRINHLVCTGLGQDEERIVLHLYVQKDGSIGKEQCYFGLEEREAVYDYSSADLVQLEDGGRKRLKELKNYKKMDVDVTDVDLELGDIISGYEAVTDTSIKKPIVNKILRIKNGRAEIEYKVKGDD